MLSSVFMSMYHTLHLYTRYTHPSIALGCMGMHRSALAAWSRFHATVRCDNHEISWELLICVSPIPSIHERPHVIQIFACWWPCSDGYQESQDWRVLHDGDIAICRWCMGILEYCDMETTHLAVQHNGGAVPVDVFPEPGTFASTVGMHTWPSTSSPSQIRDGHDTD